MDGNMDYAAGGCGSEVGNDVREWAIKNGEEPLMRIALCGKEGEHKMPESWECVAWKARKGYGSQDDSNKERIWFSPHCIVSQPTLF
jgi:hypothetical protein